MKPKQGDIVRYALLDMRGEEIYGLVTEAGILDGEFSRILPLWGETSRNLFSNDFLCVVA
jgi:hypothetical protein